MIHIMMNLRFLGGNQAIFLVTLKPVLGVFYSIEVLLVGNYESHSHSGLSSILLASQVLVLNPGVCMILGELRCGETSK